MRSLIILDDFLRLIPTPFGCLLTTDAAGFLTSSKGGSFASWPALTKLELTDEKMVSLCLGDRSEFYLRWTSFSICCKDLPICSWKAFIKGGGEVFPMKQI